MNTANSMKPTELFRLPKGTIVWTLVAGVDGRPLVHCATYSGTNNQLRFVTTTEAGSMVMPVLHDGTTGIFRTASEAAAACRR